MSDSFELVAYLRRRFTDAPLLLVGHSWGDYTVPFELSQLYLDKLKAPAKELVWFENSAHFPFLEEPAKFAVEMRRVGTHCERTQKRDPMR